MLLPPPSAISCGHKNGELVHSLSPPKTEWSHESADVSPRRLRDLMALSERGNTIPLREPQRYSWRYMEHATPPERKR